MSILKLMFRPNYRFQFFNQGRHRKLCQSRGFCLERTVHSFSLRQWIDSPNFPRSATFLFRSLFKLVVLSHYKFEFLHHELSLKHNNRVGLLMLRTRWFCLLHQIHHGPNYRKTTFNNIFPHFQTHPPLSPISRDFILSFKVSLKSFWVVKSLSIKQCRFLFVALENWPSVTPNNAINIVSSRYRNS